MVLSFSRLALAAPLAVAGLVLLTAAPSLAQDAGSRLKIQFGYPQSSDTKNVLGSPVYGFSAGYDYPGKPGSPNMTTMALDYSSRSQTTGDARVDLKYWSISTETRYFLGSGGKAVVGTSGLYAGGAVSLLWMKFKRETAGEIKENVNGIKFGGKVLAGFQTSSKLYLELEYTLPGGVPNARLLNLGIGVRLPAR